MLKKLLSGTLAIGMLISGFSAFACDCGDPNNKTYEYYSNGDGTHDVWSVCHNPWCGGPYTHVGYRDCEYEWFEYVDPVTEETMYVQVCTLCGDTIY